MLVHRSSKPRRLVAAALLALAGALTLAPRPALAQMTDVRPPTAGPFARGDRLSYDLSFSVGWKINEIRDPLRIRARLSLAVVEDARDLPPGARGEEALVLMGWSEMKALRYVGPGDSFRLEAGQNLERDVAKARGRTSALPAAAGYAGRVAALERELGIAAASLGTRSFLARVGFDGAVRIEPTDGERLAPDLSPGAEAALTGFLAQAVRFVLPVASREAVPPGEDGKKRPDIVRCDGVVLASRGSEYVSPARGRALIASTEARETVNETRPYTMEAVLGARFGKDAPREGSLDLQVQPGRYTAVVKERVKITERHGFAAGRSLDVKEIVRGQSGSSTVELEALLHWEAFLREAKLAPVAKKKAVEPRESPRAERSGASPLSSGESEGTIQCPHGQASESELALPSGLAPSTTSE